MTAARAILGLPLAHRGLHDAGRGVPENSVAGFRAAVAAGYGIELDVQVSRDGQAMVFHDAVLGRLTDETGPVNRRSAAELGEIHLVGGTGTIPTLDQVLTLIGGTVPVVIEIKDQDGKLGPDTGGILERDVARSLAHYQGPVAVMSFNPNSVDLVHRLQPDIPVGLVSADFMAKAWDYIPMARRRSLSGLADMKRVGASFISHDHCDLASAAVARARQAGLGILCWTIRSARDEGMARKFADNITFEGYLPQLGDDSAGMA